MALTKRAYSTRRKILIFGSGTFTAFFALLVSLSLYGVTLEVSGDQVCEYCNSTFNITLSNYSFCLGGTFQGLYFEPEAGVEWYHIYKADLRYRRDNPVRWKPYELKPGTCLEAGKKHEFLIEAKKSKYKTVEWSVGYGAVSKDPFWFGMNEKSHAIERNLRDYYDITFNEADWSFEIKSKINKQYLKLRPSITFNDQKRDLSKIGLGVGKAQSITKNLNEFKFGLSISKGLAIPTSIQSVSFDIMDNTSEVTASGNSIQMGDFEIDFSDLISSGFNVSMKDNEVILSDIGAKELNLDPTVKWNTNTNQISSVTGEPVNNNTFALAFCDDTQDKILLKVWDTNGTNTTPEISVDDSAGSCSIPINTGAWSGYSTDICMFNTTTGMVIWYDYNGGTGKISAAMFNNTGSIIIPQFDLGTGTGASMTVSCRALNSTGWWVGCWMNQTDRDLTCNIYNLNTASGADIDVDTEVVGAAATYSYAVSVGTFNSTWWVVGYIDRNETDASFNIFNFRTAIGAVNDEDTNIGASTRMKVSVANSTNWLYGYYDQNDQDATFSSYFLETSIKGPIDIDTAVGTPNASVSIGSQNSTQFVVLFYDGVSFDLAYGINQTFGTTKVMARTDIEDYASAQNNGPQVQDVFSQAYAVGLGLCNRNFVVAYANSSTQADFRTFWANGQVWNSGNCNVTQIPSYSLNSTNSTAAGDYIRHSLYWQGDNLAGYKFAFCNGTWNTTDCLPKYDSVQEFANDTLNASSPIAFYVNYTKPIGATNAVWNYKVWNTTGTYTENITIPGSCLAYSSKIILAISIPLGSASYSQCMNSSGWNNFKTYGTNEGSSIGTRSTNEIYDGNWSNYACWATAGYWSNFCTTVVNTIKIYEDSITWTIDNWQIDSWTSMTGTGNWSNVTKSVNTTIGTNISWYVWVNDTNGNSNQSVVYSYITTGGDSTPPTYSQNSTNSTVAGGDVSHNLYWSDAIGLSGCIFSFDNCTGTLSNDSWVSLSGTGNWSNITKSVNTTAGCTIRWAVMCNDTSNNWNYTNWVSPYNYVTTSGGAAACWTQDSDEILIPNNCEYALAVGDVGV